MNNINNPCFLGKKKSLLIIIIIIIIIKNPLDIYKFIKSKVLVAFLKNKIPFENNKIMLRKQKKNKRKLWLKKTTPKHPKPWGRFFRKNKNADKA